MEHVVWSRRPALTEPTLIAAFAGWNDAGDAATLAVRHLIEQWRAEPMASIDPEEYYDFQATRPQVRLVDGTPGASPGRPTRPSPRRPREATSSCSSASSPNCAGGPSPTRWRASPRSAASTSWSRSARCWPTWPTAGRSRSSAPPRTRPSSTASISSAAAYEGPTGIVGVLHDTCQGLGVKSLSLWAAVPAYASQVPSPEGGAGARRGGLPAWWARRARVTRWPRPSPSTRPASTVTWSRTRIWRPMSRRLEADRGRRSRMRTTPTRRPRTRSGLDPETDAEQMVEDIERFLRDQGSS